MKMSFNVSPRGLKELFCPEERCFFIRMIRPTGFLFYAPGW